MKKLNYYLGGAVGINAAVPGLIAGMGLVVFYSYKSAIPIVPLNVINSK